MQVFTCASCRARGVWQSPPAIQQGAVGCTEPLAECRWQLLGFYPPLGCWCGHSKAWSRCCHAKPQLCQSPGPYPAPPSWLCGLWACEMWQLVWVGLAFLLVVGTRQWGDAQTQPGIHLLGQWCWAGSRMCQPGQTSLVQWAWLGFTPAASPHLARSCGLFNPQVSRLFSQKLM